MEFELVLADADWINTVVPPDGAPGGPALELALDVARGHHVADVPLRREAR
jgi:hypothetical protein